MQQQRFDSLTDDESDVEEMTEGTTVRSSQQITNNGLINKRILSFKQPLRNLLVYNGTFLVLKLSRIILVLGLLFQLFMNMSCESSSIHTLLLIAFFRDVASSLLDIQFMMRIYIIRYKIQIERFDEDISEFAQQVVRCHKQKCRNAFQEKDNQGQSFCEEYEISMWVMDDVISTGLNYIGHFMKILMYSYYLLFVVSAVLVLKLDDEAYCHVFEKYAIIYLFLPFYCAFLIVALSISFFGVIITIILTAGITIIAKMMRDKWRESRAQIRKLRWAYDLNFVKYEDISHTLKNTRCEICKKEYQDKDIISVLKCTHHFHLSCIQSYIILHAKCFSCY